MNFNLISDQVCDYLRDYFERNELVQRVIVKNGCWTTCQGTNVACVNRHDLTFESDIVLRNKINKILDLSKSLGLEDNFPILIESFYEPLPSTTDKKLYHKIRCYYQQSYESVHASISDLYFELNYTEISRMSSAFFCVNENNFAQFLLRKFGLKTNESYASFANQIRRIADEFHRNLRHLFVEHHIDVGFDTPLFGLDIIMTTTECGQNSSSNIILKT